MARARHTNFEITEERTFWEPDSKWSASGCTRS